MSCDGANCPHVAPLMDRLRLAEERALHLERKMLELQPTVEEHDDRLDEHDATLGHMGVRVAELRGSVERLISEHHRLADALTQQNGSLDIIVRNTASILAHLGTEPTRG